MEDDDVSTEVAARSRTPVWLLAGVLVLILLYVVTLLLYARSGRTESYESPTDTPANGVTLVVQLGEMTAATSRLHADVTVIPGSDLLGDDDLTPKVDIDVILAPTAGAQQLRFPAGQVPATVPVEILLDGEIQNWPLDRYEGTLVVQVSHGAGASREALPLQVDVGGQVVGWKVGVAPTTDAETAGLAGIQIFQVSTARAGGTLAFGAIMLVVLVTMPVLALFVSYQVLRGRRRPEATYTGWIAAMLFATVPLRNFLPGSPPPGSWIDMTVVLWVIVGLVLALVIQVASWWRQGPALTSGRGDSD